MMRNKRWFAGWCCCGGLALLGVLVLLFASAYRFSGLVLLGISAVVACYLGLIALNRKKPKLAKVLLWVLSLCLGVGLAAAAVTGGIILNASRGAPDAQCDYILVLGAGVDGSTPSLSLWERIQSACRYLSQHPGAVAVVSGGQGGGEDISEAECMFRELTRLGIDPDRIWREEQATNTRENLRFSLDLIEERTGIRPQVLGLVSSEYHLYRAGMFAREQGITACGIPAKTSKPHLFVNYFLREIAAVWYYVILGGAS